MNMSPSLGGVNALLKNLSLVMSQCTSNTIKKRFVVSSGAPCFETSTVSPRGITCSLLYGVR